jgi:hypothetical protein
LKRPLNLWKLLKINYLEREARFFPVDGEVLGWQGLLPIFERDFCYYFLTTRLILLSSGFD